MHSNPWHAMRQTDPKVYHNDTRCTEGNNIEERYRRAGTDNRPLREHCAKYQ